MDDADKQVPQRVWTTEVALAEGAGVGKFGCRLLCTSHGDDPVFDRSVPGLVRQVVEEVDVRLSGHRIGIDPIDVQNADDVDALLGLVTNRNREADVVVFSVPDAPVDAGRIWQFARAVATAALGAVHVAVLGPSASRELSSQVGREFSVFGGSVRTYRRGFDPEDDPYLHPLALAETVYGLEEGNGRPFHDVLVDQSLRRSVARQDAQQSLPRFRWIRRIAEEERRRSEREAARDDSELLELAIEENDDLKRQMKRSDSEWGGLLEASESERDVAEEENVKLKAQNSYLRERVAILESQRLGGAERNADDELPATLDELGDWSRKHLAGSVEVVGRAVQRAKKSVFSDPELVYRALLMLRDGYVPMKRGEPNATRGRFDAACQELQVEESASISENRAGEEGDEYYVLYEGRRRLMDRHLKKGNAREERYCLRIYFFWDSVRKQVVVGSLPGHLDTRNT
ncbi:MAG: hypothetical protein F4Y86_03305 [Gammaproteobacteria bacterium]|nr:hypothetical protein [Gammaproteobacteria bacterium]